MSASGLPLHEWLARLETYSPAEIALGLERSNILLQRMQLALPGQIFHVAGTNGKGSSATMLAALLQKTGKKVGCYTSPHLQRYNERIRVNGIEAGDAEIVAAFEFIESLRGDVPLTYFEFGTLAALSLFVSAGVEIAVLEIGMGGRLDAVNAVEPTASLITNVALDHCAWLGNDVETIAVEKAGVMRAGKPVVFASTDVPVAIVDCAQSVGANLFIAGRDYSWSASGASWCWTGIHRTVDGLDRPALSGDVQLQNAAGVLTLLELAGFDELLDRATINAAFGALQLPGRMQVLGERWLLDVAHNPAAAATLAAALAARAVAGNTLMIIGMLDDKDVAGVVAPLSQYVDQWIAATARSPRAIPAAELARRIAHEIDGPCLVADSIEAAIERAAEQAGEHDLVVVTGSFYIVGAALGILAARGQPNG